MVKINRRQATQVRTGAERGRNVTGGEVLAIYMNGETLSNNHKMVRARCGGSGRATWYGAISTSRRPSRRHKAPNPHVLSWRTWPIDLWAEPMVADISHILGSAARTPIRSDRPILVQADFRSYPAPCTCGHTAGSVHSAVATVDSSGGNWTRGQLVPFHLGKHHAVDLPAYAPLSSTR